MNLGICELSYIPLRAGMSHKSEMISQVLFGEIFEICSQRGDWLKIRLLHDNYEGYIEETTATSLSGTDNILEHYDNSIICSDVNNSFIKNNKDIIIFPIGARIPKSSTSENKFFINENLYAPISSIDTGEIGDKRINIINFAKKLINTPYLWGGRTAWGIDCSGFSQLIYKLINIAIPRDACQQVSLGNTLNFLTEAQIGDLAFFDNDEGSIVHVGIISENNTIIHASKYVRIDTIDHQGIYNKTLKKYTHNLRVIKSII